MKDHISKLKTDEQTTIPEALIIAFRNAKEFHEPVSHPGGIIGCTTILLLYTVFLYLSEGHPNLLQGMILIPLGGGILAGPIWLKQRRFKSSEKNLTQAYIMAHNVVEDSGGKGGTSHYIFYAFEVHEKGIFIFKEVVPKQSQDQLYIGCKLTVEYAVVDPTLARRW